MTILCVDGSDDDAFFFVRALGQTAPKATWRHVTLLHDAKCYLKGEGTYKDRAQYPFPDLVVVDSKLPDGNGVELVKWAKSKAELIEVPFCLFTELTHEGNASELAAERVCVLQKPAGLDGWTQISRQLLEWHSGLAR